MSLLEVAGLTVATDDGRPLVRDLSFTVDTGARFGLIGESGSGKSLTALAVTGLLPAGLRATGSVTLAGTEVIGASDRRLNRVRGAAAAIVFQEPLTALDPLMRAGRQVAEPIRRRQRLRGAALRSAVLAALDEVRLADPERVARAYPHELSGGQRQRVAIAMALACRPALLIADEPTTALDVTVQADVLALLDRLVADRGMALLFIGHDLAVVARVTDTVLVLSQGAAVESGPLRELIAAPSDPFTRALVDGARRLDDALPRPVPGEAG
ncbi:ATP-binding cassette domain-containing protein [Dactylosporangium sp. CA-092794]|uniref:ATP-binding cassette domain-containing protein n=1 Tax=Dactylosporangium sp. CA-092794 TaxID=3239929 RepID=UPI003D941216